MREDPKAKPFSLSLAEEYRACAKDCAEMGKPDLAIQFLALAAQAERQQHAFAAIFGKQPS